MNAIVDWVARQEGFIIKDIPFDNIQMVLAYLFIIALIVFLSKPRFKNAIALLLGIVALQGWTIWTQVKVQNKEAFILLHKSKNTILLHQTGKILTTYAEDTSNIKSSINDYKIAERIKSIAVHELNNSYNINGKSLYVLDSSGIYPKMEVQDFLLLTQSPKVNLERVIDSIQPKIVIADGSNYPSYIERWKRTCSKKEIPFHSTGEKGYYIFDLD
ncbi:hypothetical protein [Flagellimonas eckloniae]|uniref:hypothetical protein n=1 Tax=Flagellimonas eckloniae TaxID=346185 RepID=UPI000A47C502|nr:hypothetical protein [Allomuricauda eckloniae]